jgi:ClpP class serine protease
VVALDSMSTGVNEPGEYVIAVVDRDGVLQQRGGTDNVISETLIAMLKDAKKLEEQL